MHGEKLKFLDRCLKKILKIPNFMKIRPVRIELFHVDERTDKSTHRKTWRS